MVIGYLYAALLVFPLAIGIIALRAASVDLADTVLTVGFSSLTLAWLVFPLVLSGVDETMQPARFALLPVSARRLMPGLLLSSFIGAPGVALIILTVAWVISWSRDVLSTALALCCAPLAAATCVLLSRALTSAMSAALSTRRHRERAGLVAGLAGVMIAVITQCVPLFIRSSRGEGEHLEMGWVVRVVRWSPLGWAWGAPAEAARGDAGSAVVLVVLATVCAAALYRWWQWALERALTSPLQGLGGSEKVHGGRRWERLFGMSPAGAVAARLARAQTREGQRVTALVGMVAVPLIILIPPAMRDTSGQLRFVAVAPPLVVLMAGVGLVSGTAAEGNRLWVHAVSGMRGRDDRRGRVWGGMVYPLILALSVVMVGAVLIQDLRVSVMSCAAAVAVGGISAGAASWLSAVAQWPAPDISEGAFQMNSGGGLRSAVVAVGELLLTAVGALPVMVLVAFGSAGEGWAVWMSVPVSVICGGVGLWLGVRVGGDYLDRHWSEALQAMRRQ
ncbi:hypothetical protein [Austwickia sp. TVS 96-490-7B]|uniref:hypothetical protein n=1 Tax=Austwickia sp. TVS 96-490-7B TaxID=2830843 RepID=UPI001C5A47F4|nr:hypothetical protein [Austwickia sp. TVS 96-490-7B]